MTQHPPGPELSVAEDGPRAMAAAAEAFCRAAESSVAERGAFTASLAGGSTPRALYRLLAAPPYRQRVPWDKTVLAVGDERHVPDDHPESNCRMIREELLSKVGFAEERLCRFETEVPSLEETVSRYETALRTLTGAGRSGIPRLDLILLGLGEDGHTASLFPGSAAVFETRRLAAAVWVEKLKAHRLTQTPPLINAGRTVLFLVSGAGKSRALRRTLTGPHDPGSVPAQAVRPLEGRVLWMADRDAARELQGSM